MANMAIHTTVFLLFILFYLHSSEAFFHKFRYERDAASHGSFAAVYPSLNIWQRGNFSTPAQSSAPKSQPSSIAQSTGSATGTSLPTSTFTSGKPPQSVPASAKASTPTSAQPASTQSDPLTTQPFTTAPSIMELESSCSKKVLSRCTEILSISTSHFASSPGSTVLTSTSTSCTTTTVCADGPVTTVTVAGSTESEIPLSNVPLLILRDLNQTDESAIVKFTQELADQVGAKNVRQYIGTSELGVVFWTAPLNSSQVEKFNQSSVVWKIQMKNNCLAKRID